MALDPVPWLTGGGAEHSPEVARLVSYAAVGGEGIIGPSDLRVTALATPGAGVRVLTGAAAILTRSAGAAQQAYVARNVSSTDVSIAATGSGSGRTDLVVLQVEDPFMAGEPWPVPSNPKIGPYVFFRVISGVPAGTTSVQDLAGGSPAYANRSAVTLARIEIPPNTSTISAAMIKDVRQLAQSRTTRTLLQAKPTGATNIPKANPLEVQYPSWIVWPSVATWEVRIPAWATHAVVRGSIESYAVKVGSTTGRFRATFLGQQMPDVSFDENGSANQYRSSLGFGGEVTIAAADRGKLRTLEFEGARSANQGYLDADAFTTCLVDVTFVERAT